MKKSLYMAAAAVLVLTACSDDNQIFEDSASERMEQAKKTFTDVLLKDGGLWEMEYFANANEPGYIMVAQFNKDNSVTISGNHKWIGNEFTQDTSHWDMISDNGPVLTFNSYNDVFHVFSDPANITGPDAPKNEYGEDIPETGFGHEGDYEFQVMEVSDNDNTIRFLGKKRNYMMYMHRLAADTDVESYMDDIAALPDRFSDYFPELYLVDATGESFVINDLNNFTPSVYPMDGDAITQTVSSNIILTPKGFRFLNPFEVPRADVNQPKMVMTAFDFAEDGSLVAEDGARITAPTPFHAFADTRLELQWQMQADQIGGEFAEAYTKACDEIYNSFKGKKTLEDVYFGYCLWTGGVISPTGYFSLTDLTDSQYQLEYTLENEESVSYEVLSPNNNAKNVEKFTTAVKEFFELIGKKTLVFTSDSIMKPETITVTDKENPSNYFVIKVRKKA